MKVIGHRIGGNVISDKSSRFGDVFNPATGEVESKVALASTSDVDKAVNAAKKALPLWSETPPIQRARILFKYKQLIEENIDELEHPILTLGINKKYITIKIIDRFTENKCNILMGRGYKLK